MSDPFDLNDPRNIDNRPIGELDRQEIVDYVQEASQRIRQQSPAERDEVFMEILEKTGIQPEDMEHYKEWEKAWDQGTSTPDDIARILETSEETVKLIYTKLNMEAAQTEDIVTTDDFIVGVMMGLCAGYYWKKMRDG